MSFVASVAALSAVIVIRTTSSSRRRPGPRPAPDTGRSLSSGRAGRGPAGRYDEQTGGAPRLKDNHAADRLARLERGEAGVDLVEADAPGDEFIEIKPAVEIGPRQHREIARRPRAAIARPADAFLTHQRAPAEPDFCRDVGLAQPDHLAARPHRLDAE